ncbi:MAG TPA: preprotein translocase subunit SecG [Phycisphaerae bacterium]|nr:preprotein translocase subunit SecG [Phycisphaerae bacterium]HOJ75428.1 preprotein translocase subunit SecG [Phycisphaerae bacterium]HOM49621.1 preprotein translocase subunit SecG [Phycisphaerae bacterium]HON65414.1 preprotein translocase subunit SecG [Phycisphaerae bacterium]HOQ84122.1 preprotein translocase subunit SecG [Phycisphaerae bacterium]
MLANITQAIVGVLLILVCILLILVILLQKGRGGGLAGAFGGAGGHSAFGAKTGDVFTWITIGLTAAFIGIAVIGNYVFVPEKIQPPAAQATPGQAPADAADQPALPPTATQPGA